MPTPRVRTAISPAKAMPKPRVRSLTMEGRTANETEADPNTHGASGVTMERNLG